MLVNGRKPLSHAPVNKAAEFMPYFCHCISLPLLANTCIVYNHKKRTKLYCNIMGFGFTLDYNSDCNTNCFRIYMALTMHEFDYLLNARTHFIVVA